MVLNSLPPGIKIARISEWDAFGKVASGAFGLGCMTFRRGGWFTRSLLILVLVPVVAPVALLLLFRLCPRPARRKCWLSLIEGKGAHYSWSDNIPPRLGRSVIGSEDQNFCPHHGFDWKSIDKAMAEHKRHPDKPMRGASTISQQTARTLFLAAGAKLGPQRAGGLSHRADRRAVAQEAHPGRLSQSGRLGRRHFRRRGRGAAYFRTDAASLDAAEAARLAAILPDPAQMERGPSRPLCRRRTANLEGRSADGDARRSGLLR